MVHRMTGPVFDLITQGLVRADRAGRVSVQHDCVSEFGLRVKSDTELTLQAGWNVLIKHSVEGGTGETGAMNTYDFHARSATATGEVLGPPMDTVYFDASSSNPWPVRLGGTRPAETRACLRSGVPLVLTTAR
jgi:hypothetical protein